MRLGSLIAAAVLASSLGAGGAGAAVRYDFEAFSSYGDNLQGSFTYIAPDFLTGDVSVPSAGLSSCVVTNPVGWTCGPEQNFYSDGSVFIDPSPGDIFDLVGFGHSEGGGSLYYFDNEVFLHAGVYDSILLGPEQAARLTVSLVSDVPEPASWAMMIGGFALLGAAMRRRTVAYA